LRLAVPCRVIFLLIFVLSFCLFAQIQPSVQDQPSLTPRLRSIEGTVLNKAGAPVAGAAVLLKDTKTLQVRSYITQQDGKYHFYGLSSDINYEVRAQFGDMSSPKKDVSVFDSRSRILVKLKLKNKRKPA
jgi:Carboxypeptidase regulatory-like domain